MTFTWKDTSSPSWTVASAGCSRICRGWPLPKKIDLEESKLYEFLTETVKLRSEKETYTLDGGALMDAGFKPHQPFVLSGYKLGTTRILLDTDSRMYYLKEKSE